MQVLLDVWREACRHIDITESVDRIAEVLAPRLQAELLLVRRFDLEQRRIDTVATGRFETRLAPKPGRTDCSTAEMKRMLDWCAEGMVIRGSARGGGQLLALLAPGDAAGEVLAGPLATEDGPIGALVVTSRRGAQFTEADIQLVQSLLEPFSVALANHHRVHELATLREALEADKRALLARLDRTEVMDGIVGQDAGLRTVMERVEQVAATDAPVLLLGETGTGKEVVARALHMRSRRVNRPFVRVNCGALAPGLVDSELFGHERGSFTGATTTRKGWFERADGGTLFLDEVAELALDAQVRLLRIVQDGTFERVGGQQQLTVDVRIVAATHRDLRAMVAAGRFRDDLWYRLGVFPIRLPPLRERLEDIPSLASHFARRAGMRLAGVPLVPTPDDIDLLLRYSWPGNVRELAAVIERAAILGEGHSLHVATALGGSGDTHARQAGVGPVAPAQDAAPTLEAATRQHVEDALRASRGRIEGPFGAAARLAVNPHTLRSRMRKLGIDWKRFRT